jgi:hypothetical protein
LHARIGLAVIALALFWAAPAAGATLIDQFDGVTINSGGATTTQSGKLQTGNASSCDPPKMVPQVDPGMFNINGFVEQSFINERACLTIEYSTTNTACRNDGLFSASYTADYNRTAQTGYVGDVGAAPTGATPVSYSVPIAANGFLQIIFNMSVAGAGCAGFGVKVSSDRPWLFFKQPIAGHPFVGETLTSRRDRWAGTPAFTEQWRRCARDGSSCVDIPGATAQTYVPVPDDVGHTLRVHVTATEDGMTSTADSDPLLIGVQFDAANGQSLSASDPTQNGRLNRVFATSSCTEPPKPVPSLVNATQTHFYDAFRHTNDSDGTLCTMVSVDYAALCTPGVFTSDRPLSVAYLPGFDPATSVRTNYLADSGFSGFSGERTIRYSFDVPAGAGYDVVVTSFAAGATCPGYDVRFGTPSPYPTGAPSVDGPAHAGQTLTAVEGSWTGPPTSFAYQWQRCFGDGSGCGNIPGATAKTLALTDKNVGDSFRVRVTGTVGLGSASKLSAPSGAVAEAPPTPPPPGPPDPAAYAGIALKALTKVVGSKGRVTLSLTCPSEALVGCGGTDVVRLGKATLALKPFAMGPGKTAKVSFTLSKKLRKRLAKRKRLNATQVVNSSDVRGLPVRTSAKLMLRAKPRG